MKLKDILKFTLKTLIIIGMIGMLSACASSENGEDDANSMVACGSDAGDDSCRQDDIDKNCVACKAFNFVYDAVNKCLSQTQEKYLESAPTVIMVAFAIWLALRIMRYVSSVTESNISEVWNEILRKGFVCLICFFIVASQDAINGFVNLVIMPIYMTFLELGVKIMNATMSGNDITQFQLFGEDVSITNAKYSCSTGFNLKVSSAGLPPELKNTINCIFNYLREYLSVGSKFGLKAMQGSGAIGWFVGLFSFLCFWLVKVCFAFYLVDSIFQMGVILTLLPVFVMAYAFGPTKKWANNAFGYIMSSSAFLMCFSVLCAMTVRAMVELIQGNPSIFNPSGEAHFKELSVGFMCILLISFLIYGSTGVASQLTSGLLGAKSSSNFQKKLKAVVQAGAQAAKNLVSTIFTWGTAAFPNSLMATASKQLKNIKGAVQKAAGRK